MGQHYLCIPGTAELRHSEDTCHNMRNYNEGLCSRHSASGFPYNRYDTIKGVAFLGDISSPKT